MHTRGWVVPVQVAALAALALTHPLLEVLGRSPEFFVAQRLEGAGLAAFVAVVAGLVPALFAAVAWAAGRLGPRPLSLVSAALRPLFAAAVVLQAIRHLPAPGPVLAAAALAAGVAFEIACRRVAPVNLFVTLLSPVLLVSPALFCFASPASALLARPGNVFFKGQERAAVPVVFVVFDQLPLTSLLDADGEIDGEAFPHFAALARTSTWFRETSSVSDRTEYALPAILTGRYPRPNQVPTASAHPANLFTGLAPAYRLHVHEPLTRLCPSWLCPDEVPLVGRLASALGDSSLVYLHRLLPPDLAAGLPEVTRDWRNFWHRSVQVRWVQRRDVDRRPNDWIAAIEPSGDQPVLHFLHVLLPHEPFTYLPSGQAYPVKRGLPMLRGNEEWIDDEWSVGLQYQRHLLQVGTADTFLGLLIDRLEAVGLFDRALIVVTSDHGASFRAGKHFKQPDADNFMDIMSVPFFLKQPGQREGRVSRRPTETVDILPTVADALGLDTAGRPEGRSALDDRSGSGQDVRMHYQGASSVFRTSRARLSAETLASARRKAELFDRGPAWRRKTPGLALVGRPVASFSVVDGPAIGIWFDLPGLFDDVDPSAPVVPALVSGDARGREAIVGQTLAVAVNGVVRATTTIVTGQARSPRRGHWAAILDPDVFRQGRNEVVLYQVEPGAGGAAALRKTSTASQ